MQRDAMWLRETHLDICYDYVADGSIDNYSYWRRYSFETRQWLIFVEMYDQQKLKPINVVILILFDSSSRSWHMRINFFMITK